MLSLLFLFCPLVSFGQPAEPPQDKATASRAAAVLKLVNQFRKAEGQPAFQQNDILTRAAQKHAVNMARQQKPGHVLDGKGPAERIAAEGYEPTSFGENVAFTSGGPFGDAAAFAMRFWKRSPPHRKNLLSPAFTETGIGVARATSGQWYFCLVLAAPRAAEGQDGGNKKARPDLKEARPGEGEE
jgi:uncharacterized protein YkwD